MASFLQANNLIVLHRCTGTRLSVFSLIISAMISMIVAVFFMFLSQQCQHWFIIPVILCGVLIGIDAVDWLRGRLPVFDAIGLSGMFGVFFFFVAPLLHVAWDSWMVYIIPPNDWRPWLGGMALLNALGLLLYRYIRYISPIWIKAYLTKTTWQINKKLIGPLLIISLVGSAVLQMIVYNIFGGISGYVASFETAGHSFKGLGWLFLFSESFPILLVFIYVIIAERQKYLRAKPVLPVAMLVFGALKLIFGGLRGSRNNTVFGLFWVTGIIDRKLRSIRRHEILIGIVLISLFMYIYGFYKSVGRDAVTALSNSDARTYFNEHTGRTPQRVVLGDYGRSDVQAFLLYRLMRPENDYKYAWGTTYLGAITFLIPDSLWPGRQYFSKRRAGTEAQYGIGTWQLSGWADERIYGLAGEAMLNFGPIAIPFAFALWGLLMACVQKLSSSLCDEDPRTMISPLLILLVVIAPAFDLSNLTYFLIQQGAIPILVIVAGTIRRRWLIVKRGP